MRSTRSALGDERQPEGEEAGEPSATLLMDTLGAAMRAGLGGGAVTIARAEGGIRKGDHGAFGVGLAAALLLLPAPRRLHSLRQLSA